ncbi:MAG TPA: hypothetical protein VKQ36_04315 [Ktedonobacterales bacterium]|nr:hypothetical protein [Ktedonobacterales bacterium]
MRVRYVVMLVTLGALLAGAVAYTLAGLYVYNRYRAVYADYATSCDNTLTWSPPRQLYTGFYPNMTSLVTISFRSPTPTLAQLSVSIPGFTQAQNTVEEAGPTFRALSFKPPLSDPGVLDALVGPRQQAAQIHVRIVDIQHGGRTLCDTSAPITLFSRQLMRWYGPTTGDNARYLAGWVTPQASVIGDLVGHAAAQVANNPQEYDNLPALFGYNQGQATPDQVRAQVDAIFDTLQFTYHLRYTADSILYGQSATQIIELPKDILTSAAPTGMCIETTVIMASAVERLGMRPYIIITPGHAFLGVALGAGQSEPLAYWETSDLNGADGESATVHGDMEYATARQQGKILLVIDIEAERQQGINPME